jgi:hypothetical protein
MTKIHLSQWTKLAGYGALAGAAGGLAEILWITLYGSLTGSDAAEVARAISLVVGVALPSTALIAAPVVAGITIHMVIAIGLGIALVFAWCALTRYRSSTIDEYAFMLAALALVWVLNFYVVLPLIGASVADPTRVVVDVVPYPVSLLSKLWFGLAAAAMLRYGTGNRPAGGRVRI